MTAEADTHAPAQGALPGPSDGLLAELEETYKDIHAHPELSMQERRTAGIAAAWLRQQGYEVTEGVGGTGVVGLLRNGDGRDGAAARRHGRAADPGEHRPALCQQHDRHGPLRPGHRDRAFLRARHARGLADGRDADPGREPRRLARHGDGGVPARGGNRPGRPRHDRGRDGQALPEAGRHPGPACDAAQRRTDRLAHRDHALGRGQLGGDAVRPRRAWLDAAEEHRPGGDGGRRPSCACRRWCRGRWP